MALSDRAKWNRAAGSYDSLASRAAERRWAAYKRGAFREMHGRVLFLSAGTGLDFQFFPPGQKISALDISERMLARAAGRARQYPGEINLHQMDVRRLAFRDESFDQAYTSCTFCSVSEPRAGLAELLRVLRPGGCLRMFEHTGSRIPPLNVMLHACTALTARFGPAMNRPTVDTVRSAGFEIERVQHCYLDVLKVIHARRPAAAAISPTSIPDGPPGP